MPKHHDRLKFLVCSDIHYASEAEKTRVGYEASAVANPLARTVLKFYRRYYWLRDPFAHNHLLERVTNPPFEPDWVIANGDYSCDSAFIGVSDPPSLQSAKESLGALRARFPGKVLAVFGDHELGKMSLLGNAGGLRLKSFEVAQTELGLEPIWTRRFGKYVLVGITSTLAAMPIYERETLEAESAQWLELARQHLHAIEAVFNALREDDRVLLFCHDPTALPFLWELAGVRKHIHQVERTIIGHLHSPIILNKSRILSGLPRITFMGQAIRRMSSALSKARDWKHFKVLLCPSLAGLQITKHGGFYEMRIEPDGNGAAKFHFHAIKW
jgi:hypothetical protein